MGKDYNKLFDREFYLFKVSFFFTYFNRVSHTHFSHILTTPY